MSITLSSSAPQIGLRKFNQFVASAIYDGIQHVKAEPLCPFELDLRWHDEFPLRRHHIEKHWPIMAARIFDDAFEIGWMLNANVADATVSVAP